MRVLAFDFDGVVADSVPIKDAAARALFARHAPGREQQALAAWVGMRGVFREERLRRVFVETLGEAHSPERLAERMAWFSRQVEAATVAAPEIPGVGALLRQECVARPCYVVSMAPQEEVRRVVAARGLSDCFRAVHGGPRRKRETLAELLEQEGILAPDMLFFGDSRADWEAAEVVGCRFIGVVSPGRDDPFPTHVTRVGDFTDRSLLGLD